MDTKQTAKDTAITNDEIAGFDIHMLQEVGDHGSYLTNRIIDTNDFRVAAINALFSVKAGDRDEVEKYLEGCDTIKSITNHKRLYYNEDEVSFEVVSIIPLKKVDIQVEYDGEMLDKTIFLPVNKDDENRHNAYFAD